MTISAKKILHSISPEQIELRTVFARYPRFIHAEELTHRILSSSPDMIIEINDGLMYDRNLSRNASSSRAIPVRRLIDDVLRDTAMPIHWGKNQKGMQAGGEHAEQVVVPQYVACIGPDGPYLHPAGLALSPQDAWLWGRDRAIELATAYDIAGYHKQLVNRVLEPYSHINVLITATDWDNFFELRDHKDAQPEIQMLAKAIKDAFADSEPTLLQPGQWHLPFVTDFEQEWLDLETQKKISVARCARTSYLTHEGKKPEVQKDIQLFNDLVGARPLHASPAEHQATPDHHVKGHVGPYGEWRADRWQQPHLHGNFRGWNQNRKFIERDIFKEAA